MKAKVTKGFKFAVGGNHVIDVEAGAIVEGRCAEVALAEKWGEPVVSTCHPKCESQPGHAHSCAWKADRPTPPEEKSVVAAPDRPEITSFEELSEKVLGGTRAPAPPAPAKHHPKAPKNKGR